MRFSIHRHYYHIIAILTILAVIFWSMAFYKSLQSDTPTAAETRSSAEIPTIIIDPGHGGIDPGTSASTGLLEKEVNLSIAQNLAALFEAAGYPAVLTRDSDTDLSQTGKSVAARKTEDLKARLALFEQTENAIILSIHQNHYGAASSHGAQMFYGTASPLSQTLAESIQSKIVSGLQTDNTRKIKPIDDSVYIIRHTTKPAVLCECGFLSNPEDTQKLSDADYRKKIAFCIFDGVITALKNENSREESSPAAVIK